MANDLWRTPPEVFNYYNRDFNFKVDVCASSDNALCDKYMTEQDDCLTALWPALPGDYVWCNPPYSNPLPFVKKLIEESMLGGVGSVLLVNHDMSVEWSYLLTRLKCQINVFTASGSKADGTFCSGRIAFLNAEGQPIKGNNKGQFCAVIPPFVTFGEPETKYKSLADVMRIGGYQLATSKSNKLAA